MKNILIIFLVLLIVSCAPKTYNAPFVNSEEIQNRGFFIGLHTNKLSSKLADYISNKLLDIDFIK